MLKIFQNAEIAQQAAREIAALKAENLALKANIDYLSMMSDIELDSEEESEDVEEI